MSRSFSARRPYVRQTKSITRRASQDLVSRAGQVPIDRPMVEQLEPRKLLFSLTIDGSQQDASGNFYADAYFGYFIPYFLSSAEPGDPDDGETLDEDFNDEMIGQIAQGQQRVLQGSNILLRNISAQRVAIEAPNDDTGQPVTDETVLHTIASIENQQFSLTTLSANNANALRNVSTSVTFRVRNSAPDAGGPNAITGNGFGLLNGAIEIQTLFQGQVQRTYTQADLAAINGTGLGLYTLNAQGGDIGAFDEIRFIQTEDAFSGPGIVAFDALLDDFSFLPPSEQFADIVDSRKAGAYVRITGQIGATVQLLDLYGREIRETVQVGRPGTNVNYVFGDFNGDGIPEYNDGIGQINLSGFGDDPAASLYLTGGVITPYGNGPVPQNSEFFEPAFAWQFTALSYVEQFEDIGFGFFQVPDSDRDVSGLPNQAAQLIIGSPYDRPLFSYNPGGTPQGSGGAFNFINPEQGVFLTDGSTIGDVGLNAILMGSSQFDGSVGTFSTGINYGSLSVAGDLTAFVVASDSGVFSSDPDDFANQTVNGNFATGSQILVGRSLREFVVGGKNLSSLVVDGDLNSTDVTPINDILIYDERETIYGFDPNSQAGVRAFLQANREGQIAGLAGTGFNFLSDLPKVSRAPLFGDATFRNDTILSAEFINSPGTSTIIRGSTGGQDTVSTGEDAGDVFGIAVDGTREIVVEAVSFASALNAFIRILDSEGRTVASVTGDVNTAFGSTLRYTPDGPGVYYIAVGHGTTVVDSGIDLTYSLLVSGLAPTNLASYRNALGFGSVNDDRQNAADGEIARPVVVLNSGSVGAIRVGTGYVNGAGAEVFATSLVNTLDNDDDNAVMSGFSFSTPGNLYNITAGGDIGGGNDGNEATNDFTVGGHFGSLYTGLLAGLGTDYTNGDVAHFTLVTGGQIGQLNIGGAVGTDQDDANNNLPLLLTQPVIIRTGVDADLMGHIGMIRVGSHVAGDTLTIDTSASPGSIVGGLLVAQDVPTFGNDGAYGDDFGIFDGFDGINLQLGQDSDIRFVDTPMIDLQSAAQTALPIITGQTLTIVDDAGGRVDISVTSLEVFGFEIGRVIIVPVDGSQGVAIARIEIDDLSGTGTIAGGRTLRIRGENGQTQNDIISIGRILIRASDAFSNVVIEGPAQIDVWRIDAPGGLNSIDQNSPLGDIVAIDTNSLNQIRVRQGDLGRTQLVDWGPSQIGPFLGIQSGLVTMVEGAIGLGADVIDRDWNGGTFRPTNASNIAAGNAFLDDVGSPFDGYLNGIIIRNGAVQLVESQDGLGDVITQGGVGADLITVRANFDRSTNNAQFEGIFGTIFSAHDIDLVEIGDGLAGPGSGPLARAGIFASAAIDTIRENVNGANIEGVIAAGLNDPDFVTTQRVAPINGINRIQLTTGGSISGAYIGTSTRIDEFWFGIFYGNDRVFGGVLNDIIVTNGDIFRSTIETSTLDSIVITNGFYDASEVNVVRSVTTNISASGFRNSTIGGDVLEFRLSRIIVAEDLERLTVTGNGDFVDTALRVTGSVVRSITASSFIRANIAVANTINSITLAQDLLASTITAGQLLTMNIADSIRTSTINVSGPIRTITVGNEVTRSAITVSGPDGRIDTLRVANLLSADIVSSGRIGTIQSTNSDIRGSITTTTDRGDITLITAARDIAIETDIGGDLAQLVAGRNIGDSENPSVILVRGQLGTLNVSGGRIFSDLRVGEGITGITIGAAVNRPLNPKADDGDIQAFGRIQSVTITGDYDGEIVSESGGIGTVTVSNGSLLPDAKIIARDGGIGTVLIVAGHLMGSIFSDQSINLIRVEASADGVFGDVGINPNLSAGVTTTDPNRNQLPPDVVATNAIDGPVIAALRGINRFVVTNGSIFDTLIYAGTNLGLLDVNGNVQSDGQQADDTSVTIAAGDQIQNVQITGGASDTLFLAGVTSFGSMPIFNILESTYADRPGGTGASADTIKSGRIQNVSIGGNAADVTFSAGMTAGTDGLYGTGDERHVIGFSYVEDLTIGGTRTNVTVSADRKWYTLNGTVITPAIQNSDATLNNAGRNAANDGGLLESLTGAFVGGSINLSNLGVVVDFGTTQTFAWNGTTFTVQATSSQAGAANADPSRGIVWDFSRGRLVLANTRMADGVIVTILDNDNNPSTPLPELIDFDIVSNDEASIGLIRVNGNLRGGSDIIVDNYIGTLDIDDYDGTGQIIAGVDVGTMTVGRFAGGSITANFVDSFNVTQSLVASGGLTPTLDFTGMRSFTVAQNATANINVDRSITGIFSVGGTVAQTLFRAGGSVTNITANELSRVRISVANSIGQINVAGNVFDTAILAGGDLGTDSQIGTNGDSSTVDRATSGSIGAVNIGGNFRESDIVAGYLRGPDGFFGTDDDTAASGISTIGNVNIEGTGVGSNVNSESYAIAAAGNLSFVTIDGTDGMSVGNFSIDEFTGLPLPIQVISFDVTQDARVYTAKFVFNQDIDTSTFNDALSIREVVSEGNFIPLDKPTGVPGSGDYEIEFDVENRTVTVTVDRAITDEDLIDNMDGTFSRPAGAAAGVYRIELDADVLRSRVSQARLDGNGDGFAAQGDDFTVDDIIGDAGDAGSLRPIEQVDVNGDGSLIVDYFGPTSLDQVFDSNRTPDGTPDINNPFVLRGALGDHPDRDLNDFGFGGDIDVYEISLQAGQILQLGEISGPAFQAQRSIYFQPAGIVAPELLFSQQGSGFTNNIFLQAFGTETDQALPLPVQPAEANDRSDGAALLIKETGTYYIVVESGNTPSASWYTPGFVLDRIVQPNQIGNYQFSINIFDDGNSGFSDGGDAGNGTNVVHAPPLALFADPDDTVVIGDYTFSRTAGADGVFGNNDDVVAGTSVDGERTSTRQGTRLVNTISSSIGDSGVTGLPGEVQSDVDIWHLNNRQPIAPGTLMTITVKLAEIGTDLGSTLTTDAANFTSLADFSDFTKDVQFGLFDTTSSFEIGDANLVFSPTDFESRAAEPNTIIAENGPNRYGFDANGDFFITFVTPPAIGGAANASGTFAIYLQGAFRGDYEIEVVTQGTGSQQIRSQNVLIETAGGVLDWLSVNGAPIEVGGFDAGSLGFSGRVNNVPVNTYILTELINTLNDVFAASGFDVTFSTNPADFEFQEFSTVFLSSDHDPIGLITLSDYGYAEHSDPLNTDSEDEAVVFSPDLSTLGFSPSQDDLDRFVQSLTAATGRRVGELLGLRLTSPDIDVGDLDLFNETSVSFTPLAGADFFIPNSGRRLASNLSSLGDTGFFLGQQNAESLLDRILAN